MKRDFLNGTYFDNFLFPSKCERAFFPTTKYKFLVCFVDVFVIQLFDICWRFSSVWFSFCCWWKLKSFVSLSVTAHFHYYLFILCVSLVFSAFILPCSSFSFSFNSFALCFVFIILSTVLRFQARPHQFKKGWTKNIEDETEYETFIYPLVMYAIVLTFPLYLHHLCLFFSCIEDETVFFLLLFVLCRCESVPFCIASMRWRFVFVQVKMRFRRKATASLNTCVKDINSGNKRKCYTRTRHSILLLAHMHGAKKRC